ncbi:MAG: hypothetical protein IJ062_11720 [Firmicutes bacterium]|nr:hypothetical protein [Bacillota bacterium]
MKKYTTPVAEIEYFESTDIITVSVADVQDESLFGTAGADALGLGN